MKQEKLGQERIVEFPRVKGKTLERIELRTSEDSRAITVDFDDQTALTLAFEYGFAVQAAYQDWERDGLPRLLKKWPAFRT